MATKKTEEKRSLEVAEAARETEWQQPSFVGELFMGRLNAGLLYPFPEQSDEDRAAGDAVLVKLKKFLEEKVDADAIDREKEIPKSVYTELAEMGLFGIKLPQEYGGLGMSQVNYNRIIQMVSSHCASTAVMLSAHQSIGVPQPIKMFGTDEQKKKFLPRLAKGAVSAFALTEPGVGSDPSSMTTTARLDDDGETWIINGQKLWISNGPVADLMIVMARTNDPKADRPEITAFVVEGDAPGLSTAHRCDFMGLKGLQNGLINFENVRVPKENIVEGLGRGLSLALRTLNTGRLTLPAACGGAMKHALEMVLDWTNDRKQWGAPIGHHEAVANRTATLAAEIFAVEAITWLTSAMADDGRTDIRLEAAMAKLFCTEALWRGVDSALQTRGGRGYETADSLAGRGEKPMPMERLMRDARINLIIEGTSDIMRLFIAREALDPHLKMAGASATSTKVNLVGAIKFYATWYPAQWFPHSVHADMALPHKLSRHLRYVEKASRRLARDLFHMIVRHQQGLQKKQEILGRIVDSGAELFAMMAALSYTTIKNAPANAGELADLFCQQSRRRVDNMHRAIYCNDDVNVYRTSRKVLDGEYAWLDDNIITTWRKGD